MTSRDRLAQLTDRWRTRRDERQTLDRPPAERAREALAAHAFPFRSVSPAAYVDEHGADMVGFTFDEERYIDPELDAWLADVGRLLRLRR